MSLGRRALVVGIDRYTEGESLTGCVADAKAIAALLARNADESLNFYVRELYAPTPDGEVRTQVLRSSVRRLFEGEGEIALLYFAGHGYLDGAGGFLLGSDAATGDDGFSLHDIVALASSCGAENRVIILDSCHSGAAGRSVAATKVSDIAEGMTILTASTAEQAAEERGGHGVFTRLLIDALSGGASNLVGEVTPGSVYAHIDKTLGGWGQRPVFRTNVKSFVQLRRTEPHLPLPDLRRISTLFPTAAYEFPLDPSFEENPAGRPESAAPPVAENCEVFRVLQRYNRVGLLVPVGAEHMWHAAMHGKSCRLTAVGEYYRSLVALNLV